MIIPGDLYELFIFCKSKIFHNNSHLNTLSQHKMNLMYVKTLAVNKLETWITYK